MGGIFGSASRGDAVPDVDITNAPFRTKFEEDLPKHRGHLAMGVIKYQRLDDMIAAIGLPRERLCTYCWDGAEPCPARSTCRPAS